jgi:class 3 adenylate cyclase
MLTEHRGRIIRTTGDRTTGDGLLVVFVSAVDALRCAVKIQGAGAPELAGAVV